MTVFALYLAKIVLCSGILTGYYWLALRNKTFHRWNRFYLLFSVVISLAAPLLKINIWQTGTPQTLRVFRMLNVVTAESESIVESKRNSGFSLTAEQMALLGYAFVSVVLLLIVATSAVRIYKIIRTHFKTRFGKVIVLNTDAPGTPFSFFNYIVWNSAIDLNTETGQQIFRHELAHVRQRHTWDKLFILLILIPLWTNPFFWIIRKELHALHEFSADEKALESYNAGELAQLILNTAFPQQHFLFTNPFFQSTIKRRIAMFTKLQNPSVSYASRILVLPLLFILIAAFSTKVNLHSGNTSSPALDKTITVVIDAGHGGMSGARSGPVYEDDLVLAISKKIKDQNSNKSIRIILTREDNQMVDLKKRVEIASQNGADLFISVHVNAAPPVKQGGSERENPANGIEVVVPTKNPPYQQQSEVLGSALVQELSSAYTTQKNLIRKQIGVWVIDHNVCPSVLIECGYLTNKKDLAFISQEQNQTLIANKILDAIARYGVLKNMDQIPAASDTPKLKHRNKEVAQVVHIRDAKNEVEIHYKDGTKETVTANEAKKADLLNADTTLLTVFTPPVIVKDTIPADKQATKVKVNAFKGVIVIDGKVFNGTMDQIPIQGADIESMDVFKDSEEMIKEYGSKAKDGVIRITTKKGKTTNRPPKNETGATGATHNRIFRQTETESFTLPFKKKDDGSVEIIGIASDIPFKGIIVSNGEVFNGLISELPVKADDIESINFQKGSSELVEKYGLKAKTGMITIIKKN